MGTEHISGFKFAEGDVIRGYTILQVFEPGAFCFTGKAKAPDGRLVFIKKFKRPGSCASWYDAFVEYQAEIRRRIQRYEAARRSCYEFVDAFELTTPGGPVPKRAYYQVFEWIEGGMNLRAVIDRCKSDANAFSWGQRVTMVRRMVEALKAIHEAGVIHCDLKPEDVLMRTTQHPHGYMPVLSDFDFSLLHDRQAPWASDGYVGTPKYMSPEHLRGEVPAEASDVFAATIIISELLGMGHPSADDMEAYEQRAKNGTLRSPELQQPITEAPDKAFVEFVIGTGLDPRPENRPSADDLLRVMSGNLQEFKGHRPVTVP